MINIFIADDHELVREGLKKILKEENDMIVIGEANNATDVLIQMRDSKCDILLLDMNMPGRSGIDLITDLKIMRPQLRILILSIHPEDRLALRTLKAGASGYISKDTALEELVVAIRRIHTRGKYLSAKKAEQLAFDIGSDPNLLPHEKLSSREHEILCLIASNRSVKEIAADLSLSISTVNTYRARIFEKMNMRSNVELTRYALDHNLVD
jgi:DNA-binding NarL/FixJ family response regulator